MYEARLAAIELSMYPIPTPVPVINPGESFAQFSCRVAAAKKVEDDRKPSEKKISPVVPPPNPATASPLKKWFQKNLSFKKGNP